MGTKYPAVVPAVGLLAGSVLAPELVYLPVGALFALLALALCLPRPSARFLAALALGLLSSTLRAPAPVPAPDPRRPVEVAGRVTSHPVRRPDEPSGEPAFFRLRTTSLRQGKRIRVAHLDVWVSLPPDAGAPAIGTVLRLRGYLRRSAGFANGVPARPPAFRMRIKSARFLTVDRPAGEVLRRASDLRRHLQELLERGGEARSLTLVRALVLGDRSRLPKSWTQALRRSGLAHLLAVSGLHVGLVALLLLLAAAPLPTRLRLLAAGLGIVVYLLVLGPRPSVLRAAAMGLLGLLALACERPPQVANALACGVALLVLWEPATVADLSFQLSVAATAGILTLATLWDARWRSVRQPSREATWGAGAGGGWLRRSLAVSIAAQVATLPWILTLSGGFHPLAPLLNLVAIPYLGLFLFAAFLWLAIAAGSSSAAAWLLPLLEGLAAPVAGLASVAPSAAFFRPLRIDAVTAWLLAIGLAWGLGRPRLLGRGAVVLALLLATGSAPPESRGPVELAMIDVGQGEAILIRDGPRVALVDGGGWRSGDLGGRILVPVLAAAGVHRLDAVVLTHPDVDHCGGLVDVARYLPVGELWMGPGWSDHPCAAELLVTPGIRWRSVSGGDERSLGRWRLTVLHPPSGAGAGASARRRGRNDRSLVIAAEVFGRRVLLTGDVGSEAERRLLKAGADLRADVLKVAHHGSKTSTTPAFLRAVAPRLALISAGVANPYGHPAPAVVERLAAAGVVVLRTDRSGLIRLRFHPGGRMAIETPGLPR